MERIEDVERALHAHTVQKQSYIAQLHEIESALHELEGEETAYKLIGSIMVKTSPQHLLEELQEQKQTITTRIARIEKQEQELQQEMSSLQKDMLGGTNVRES